LAHHARGERRSSGHEKAEPVKKSDLEKVVDLVERIDVVRRFRTTLNSAGRVTLMSAVQQDRQGKFEDKLSATLPVSDDIHTPIDAAIDLHERGLIAEVTALGLVFDEES